MMTLLFILLVLRKAAMQSNYFGDFFGGQKHWLSSSCSQVVAVPGSRAACQGLKSNWVQIGTDKTILILHCILYTGFPVSCRYPFAPLSLCLPIRHYTQPANKPSIQHHFSLSFRVFYSLRMVVTLWPYSIIDMPSGKWCISFWQMQTGVVRVSSVHTVHTRRGTHRDVVHKRRWLKHKDKDWLCRTLPRQVWIGCYHAKNWGCALRGWAVGAVGSCAGLVP